MINTLGIIGALVVTYSNVPQIWMFIKQGHARGISLSSTWIGFIGVGLRTIYLAVTTHMDLIALGPYFFAIACLILTLYYIYFPTSRKSRYKKAAKLIDKWSNEDACVCNHTGRCPEDGPAAVDFSESGEI